MRMESDLVSLLSARDNRVTPTFGESRQATGTMSHRETGLVGVHMQLGFSCSQVLP